MYRGLCGLYYGSLFCVFVAWGARHGAKQRGEGSGSAVIEVSAGGVSSLLPCPVLHMGAVPAKLA